MKDLKLASALVAVFVLIAGFAPICLAAGDQGDSITITIDRRVMPQSVFHIGRFYMPEERAETTVTVFDHVIRNYNGEPTKAFIIQTASGRTDVPIATVKEITIENFISRRTDDIPRIENVVEADMILVDGTEKHVLMNADFGTIEGKTDRGEFFLRYPHTVRHIIFNR